MRYCFCSVMMVAVLFGGMPAMANEFPSQPIRIVVGYPPGGATDVLARIVARRMSEIFGKSVVVENRPGAAGSIGTRLVAQARPDGYTLLMGTAAQAVRMAFAQPGFDLRKDFAPLVLIASVPNVVLAHPSFPGLTFQDLLDIARRSPDSVSVGSTGTGGSAHMGLELLQSMANIKVTHVPYKGSAPGITDLLAGHIPVMIDALSTAVPLVQSGKLRALAVTSRSRSAALPAVPAVAEIVSGFEAEGWYGLFAVAGTAPNVLSTLQDTIDRIVGESVFTSQARKMGAVPRPIAPEGFSAFVNEEVAKWTRVVADRKIVLE